MNLRVIRSAASTGLGILTRPEKELYKRRILTPERLALPGFIGIGFARSGTTWLWENLQSHPEVHHRRGKKELSYFDGHFSRPLKRWYCRYFEGSGGLISGEISPGYVYLPGERIRFMRNLMPEVRLLVVVRHPVERAWSETALFMGRAKNRRLADADPAAVLSTTVRRAERCDYARLLDAWYAEFPEHQILVSFFEDIAERPRQMLADIFAFLGLTQDVDWKNFPIEATINATETEPMSDAVRRSVEEIYRSRIKSMRRVFGNRVDRWDLDS